MSGYRPKEERASCSWNKVKEERYDDTNGNNDRFEPRTKMSNMSSSQNNEANLPRFKQEGTWDTRDAEVRAKCVVDTKQENYKEINAKASRPKNLKRKRFPNKNGKTAKKVKKAAKIAKASKQAIKSKKSDTVDKSTKSNQDINDNLVMALVDDLHYDGRRLFEKWDEIESRLADMVTDRILAVPEGPIPSFDSSDVIRGHRVIKCDDGFSKIFLSECVASIGHNWDGLRIRLVHVSEIPLRPRARIYLPKGQTDHKRILSCLRAQNVEVDMADWVVLRAEETLSTSQPFLLLINHHCLPQLEAVDYKVRYGIRMAKVKIFLAEGDEDR
ncbi:uncharacterized protein LOC108088369 isoform X2 [Drosophila ficusphila]|uniref:uncharacterized protein LOC108088369 isoform X2 n=1 Tax=Drosophila ficusphila TaxID=30025 RepID=UPI0007E5DE52|nr:uncharacterized protein LOC108088369 isoform X2 [Drosophila ficusphila]